MADTDVAEESIIIKAPMPQVYETLGDFEAYPEWLTEFKAVTITRLREDGWADEVRYTLGAVGITVDFTLTYDYSDTRVEWKLVEGTMLERLDGAYDMTDRGDGTTELVYELAVSSSIPLPGMVRRRVAKKIITDSLKAIKQRAEQA